MKKEKGFFVAHVSSVIGVPNTDNEICSEVHLAKVMNRSQNVTVESFVTESRYGQLSDLPRRVVNFEGLRLEQMSKFVL